MELYNLKKDLGQRNNLATEHPEKVKQLQKALHEVRDRGYSAPRFN